MLQNDETIREYIDNLPNNWQPMLTLPKLRLVFIRGKVSVPGDFKTVIFLGFSFMAGQWLKLPYYEGVSMNAWQDVPIEEFNDGTTQIQDDITGASKLSKDNTY